MFEVGLENAGVIAMSLLLLWLFSVWRADVSWIDPFWPAGFLLITANTCRWLAERPPSPGGPNAWFELLTSLPLIAQLYLAAVLLWSGRLTLHLLARKLRHPDEDYRYRTMREQVGPSFWLRSLFTVFLLQGFLMWFISWPIVAGLCWAADYRTADSPWEVGIGLLAGVVWLIGFYFEAVGDWQLTQFQRDPANRQRVLDFGVWRYSRHPNYFGECCIWWAFFGFTWAISWTLSWTVLSPLLVTFLLLKVSGVGLLEKTIHHRRPGYADYVRKTNAFFPWWPQRN